MKRHRASKVAGVLFAAAMAAAAGCPVSRNSPPEDVPTNDAGATMANGGMAGSVNTGGGEGALCACLDKGQCVDATCSEGICEYESVTGRSCNNGDVCNKAGECVPCLDDDQTCPSGDCPQRCDGAKCMRNEQCKKGVCALGRCCNDACEGPCKSCDQLAYPSMCTPLPKGRTDPECSDATACDGTGSCKALAGMKPLGGDCNDTSACFSGACLAPYCRLEIGASCDSGVDCSTNICSPVTHKCIDCDPGQPCNAVAACNLNRTCPSLPGQPCENHSSCAFGWCKNHLCKLSPGDACTTGRECESGACKDSKCTPSGCGNGTNACEPGTTCDNNICLLPSGAYCIESMQCTSNKCDGFPRKCQP